jgi:hypothetical protein
MQIISEFSPLYAAGSLTPTQERNFLMAVKNYTQESQTEFTDPLTGLKSLRMQGNKLPPHVIDDLNKRRPGSAPASLSVMGGSGAGTAGQARPAATKPSAAGASASLGLTPDNATPETYQAASTAPRTTFFDLAGTGTGFVPVLVAGVARNVPLDAVGNIKPEFQQSTAMLTSMSNRIVNALQENPLFAEGERKMIKAELNIEPRLLTNKNAFINQIIALDNAFEKIENTTYSKFNNPQTGIAERNKAAKKLEDISSVRRDMLGIQQRTFMPTTPNYDSDEDRNRWAKLPPGQYIVLNPQGFKEVREKKPAAQR